MAVFLLWISLLVKFMLYKIRSCVHPIVSVLIGCVNKSTFAIFFRRLVLRNDILKQFKSILKELKSSGKNHVIDVLCIN